MLTELEPNRRQFVQGLAGCLGVSGLLLGASARATTHAAIGNAHAADKSPLSARTIPWSVLSDVRMLKKADSPERPLFSAAVKALNGKAKTVRGFIVPLDGANQQRHFLLCPSRTDCRDDPLKVVYVRLKSSVEFRMSMVDVTGKFNVSFNLDTGIYYRMLDAEVTAA